MGFPGFFVFLAVTTFCSGSLFTGVSFKPRPPHSNKTISSLSPILPPKVRVNSSAPLSSLNHTVGNRTRVNFKHQPQHYNQTVNSSLPQNLNSHVTTENDSIIFPGNGNESTIYGSESTGRRFLNSNVTSKNIADKFLPRSHQPDWTGVTSLSSHWDNSGHATLSKQNVVGSNWTSASASSPPNATFHSLNRTEITNLPANSSNHTRLADVLKNVDHINGDLTKNGRKWLDLGKLGPFSGNTVEHSTKMNSSSPLPQVNSQHAAQNNGTKDEANQRRVIGAAPRCPVGKLMDDSGKCRDPM